MFQKPVRWKHGSDAYDSDAAFRFVFSVSDIDEYERATLRVLDTDVDYEPGYMQIYCEGAAMRQLKHDEPYDRLAVFFKNLSLNRTGADLEDVEARVRDTLFGYIENPEDCVWTTICSCRRISKTCSCSRRQSRPHDVDRRDRPTSIEPTRTNRCEVSTGLETSAMPIYAVLEPILAGQSQARQAICVASSY